MEEIIFRVVLPTSFIIESVYLNIDNVVQQLTKDCAHETAKFVQYYAQVKKNLITCGKQFSFTYAEGGILTNESLPLINTQTPKNAWYRYYNINEKNIDDNERMIVRRVPDTNGHIFCFPILIDSTPYINDDFITPYLIYLLNALNQNKEEIFEAIDDLYSQLLHQNEDHKLSFEAFNDSTLTDLFEIHPFVTLHLLSSTTSISVAKRIIKSIWGVPFDQNILDALQLYFGHKHLSMRESSKSFAPFYIRYFFSSISNYDLFFDCIYQLALVSSDNHTIENLCHKFTRKFEIKMADTHEMEDCQFCSEISKIIVKNTIVFNEKYFYFSLLLPANKLTCFINLFGVLVSTIRLKERSSFLVQYEWYISEKLKSYIMELDHSIEQSPLPILVENLISKTFDEKKQRKDDQMDIDVDYIKVDLRECQLLVAKIFLPILIRMIELSRNEITRQNINIMLNLISKYLDVQKDQKVVILEKLLNESSGLISIGENWMRQWEYSLDQRFIEQKVIAIINAQVIHFKHSNFNDINQSLLQLCNSYRFNIGELTSLLANQSFKENFFKVVISYLEKNKDQYTFLSLVPSLCDDPLQYAPFNVELEQYIITRVVGLLNVGLNTNKLMCIFNAICKDLKFQNPAFFSALIQKIIEVCMKKYNDSPPDVDVNSIAYKVHKLLFFGEFWYQLLHFKANVKSSFEENIHFTQILRIWTEINRIAKKDDWIVRDIRMIKKLSLNSELLQLYIKNDLHSYWHKIDECSSNLQTIEKYLQVLCNGTIQQKELLALIQKIDFENLKVKDIEECLKPFEIVKKIGSLYGKYWESHSFRNVFDSLNKDKDSEILIELPVLITRYNQSKAQFNAKWIQLCQSLREVSYASAMELLHGFPSETTEQIDEELTNVRRLIPDLPIIDSSSLHYMCEFNRLYKFFQSYLKFIALFKIPRKYYKDIRRQLKLIQNNPAETSLLALNDCLRQVINIKEKLFSSNWSAELKQNAIECFESLATSKPLVNFLVQSGDADLRVLMDAVEEHSDNFIRTDTVRDVVLVKHFLTNFITYCSDKKWSEMNDLDDFLKEANNLFESLTNPHLKNIHSKIYSVNQNSFALKRLFDKVGNRSELTKETVKLILDKGILILTPGDFYVVMEQCPNTLLGKRSHNENDIKSAQKVHSKKRKTTTEIINISENIIIEENDNTRIFTQQELIDLRSRSLLINNSKRINQHFDEDKMEDESNINEDELFAELQFFAEEIDLAKDIAYVSSVLVSLGHFDYYNWVERREIKKGNLRDILTQFSEDLRSWRIRLNCIRQFCYLLNFYFGSQLIQLLNIATNKNKKTHVKGFKLLQRTLPNLTLDEISAARNKCTKEVLQDWEQNVQHTIDALELELIRIDGEEILGQRVLTSSEKRLFRLGNFLTILCEDNQFVSAAYPLPPNISEFFSNIKLPKSLKKESVDEIELYTIRSDLFIQILSVYIKYHTVPYSHNLLFCQSTTTTEEIDIFLQRCFYGSCEPFLTSHQVFSIINVERLTAEQQTRIVDKLEELAIITKEKESIGRHLAIFVCTDSYIPAVEKFKSCQKTPINLPLRDIQQYCRNLCSNRPYIVASRFSGLGKSKLANEISANKNIPLYPISIYDQISRESEMNSIKSYFKNGNGSGIHINIGKVSDILLLNTILFEVLIVGTLSSQENSLNCRSIPLIIIEIANTPSDSLLYSLFFSRIFKVEYLEWDLSRFESQQNIDSPIQIVCTYLKAIKDNSYQDFSFEKNAVINSKKFSSKESIDLLQEFFFKDYNGYMNFTLLDSYLRVFSHCCLMMSRSSFFKTSALHFAFGKHANQIILKALLGGFSRMAIEFSTRSISQARNEQIIAEGKDEGELEALAKSVENMVKWNETDHFMIFFNRHDIASVSAVYKSLDKIPKDLAEFFRIQNGGTPLPKLSNDNVADLWEKLFMCCSPDIKEISQISTKRNGESPNHKYLEGYALTLDNLLKMFAIVLRISSKLPVIIMGESGCGKTSLIQVLSNVYQSKLIHHTCHAGTTLKDLEQQIIKAENQYKKRKQQIWIFLDEINTCNHLGAITELLCNRTFMGAKVNHNFTFLAACNPYRMRPISAFKHIHGLKGKLVHNQMSRLVYSVHAIPMQLFDYIWDFGSLSDVEQSQYTLRMVEDSLKSRNLIYDSKLYCKLLDFSQAFIAKKISVVATSLRDIKRCILIYKWFYHQLANRSEYELEKKSMILALCHCYYVRIDDRENRREYAEYLSNNTGLSVIKILKNEQKFYVDMMTLPKGIAKNEALLENVFVLLICILNRLPVFIVGKPGCSKSLAMQLIKSNLRGPDSPNAYFRKLPQIFPVHYQGSEQSTSEGIIKIFEKAEKAKSFDVLPCVVLDEVGLAEISQHNPLKVLHPLLEPSEMSEGDEDNFKRPNIAVVGISNWALDPAKMNRAIHLSRTEPDLHDLIETGREILKGELPDHYSSYEVDQFISNTTIVNIISHIAIGYTEYINKYCGVNPQNFHGLRDYYSLIKSLSPIIVDYFRNNHSMHMSTEIMIQFKRLLDRNFGGIPLRLEFIYQKFLSTNLYSLKIDYPPCNVVDLIKDNIADRNARHMLLIVDGDSGIATLQRLLNLDDPMILIGSSFRDDLCEDYYYRLLSKIILTMEQGKVLILNYLDPVYGALYDLLNQNYSHVGNVQNCRIALGAYSSPMCAVHPNFRCIVIKQKSEIEHADPPFLNRFEKQRLSFSDIVSNFRVQRCHKELLNWVEGISKVAQVAHQQQDLELGLFTMNDFFLGYSEETIPSAILNQISLNDSISDDEIIEKCKSDLIWMTKIEGITRITRSNFALHDPSIVESIQKIFNQQSRGSLVQLLQHILTQYSNNILDWGDKLGFQIVINTTSPFYEDIKTPLQHIQLYDDVVSFINPSDFSSEKSLCDTLDTYFNSRRQQLLIIRCDAEVDQSVLLLTKFLVENRRRQVLDNIIVKHCAFIIHFRKNIENSVQTPFNILSNWKIITIDSLVQSARIPLTSLLSKSIEQLLQEDINYETNIQNVQLRVMARSFNDFQYPKLQNQTLIRNHIQNILSNQFPTRFNEFISKLVLQNAKKLGNIKGEHWSVIVASDPRLIHSTSSYCNALLNFFDDRVSFLLTQILFMIEEASALECMIHHNTMGIFQIWEAITMKRFSDTFVQNDSLPTVFTIEKPIFGLVFPYSTLLAASLNMKMKNDFFELLSSKLKLNFDLQFNYDEKDAKMQNVLNSTIINIEHKIEDGWRKLLADDSPLIYNINMATLRDLIEKRDNFEYYTRDAIKIEILQNIDNQSFQNVEEFYNVITCLFQRILLLKSESICKRLSVVYIHFELQVHNEIYTSFARLIQYCIGKYISFDYFRDLIQHIEMEDHFSFINNVIAKSVLKLFQMSKSRNFPFFLSNTSELYHLIQETNCVIEQQTSRSSKLISSILVFSITLFGNINSFCKDEKLVKKCLRNYCTAISSIIRENMKGESSNFTSHPQILQSIESINNLLISDFPNLSRIIYYSHLLESLIEINENMFIEGFKWNDSFTSIILQLSILAREFTPELNNHIQKKNANCNQLYLLLNKSISIILEIVLKSISSTTNQEVDFLWILSNFSPEVNNYEDPILTLISKLLEDSSEEEKRQDSGFALVIVNLIETQHFSAINYDEIDIPSIVRYSLSVIYSDIRTGFQLVIQLIAISFIKSIFSHIALLCSEGEQISEYQYINDFLTCYESFPVDKNIQSPIFFFLRSLYHNLESIKRIKEVIDISNVGKRLYINNLPWSKNVQSRMDCPIFSGVKNNEKSVEIQLSSTFRQISLSKNNDKNSQFLALIKSLSDSPLSTYSYLSNLFTFCYFPLIDEDLLFNSSKFKSIIQSKDLPKHLQNRVIAKLAEIAVDHKFKQVKEKNINSDLIETLNLSPRLPLEKVAIGCLLYHIWTIIVSLGPSTPFYSLLCYSSKHLKKYERNIYLPAVGSNDFTKIISIVKDGTTKWECKECGNIYLIGDCGNPAVEGKCFCGKQIGGKKHIAVNGSSKLDENSLQNKANAPGYIEDEISILLEKSTTVRNLSTISYRVLHLLLNVTLVGRSIIQDDLDPFSSIQGLNKDQDLLRFNELIYQKITIDLQILSDLLGSRLITTYNFLHSLLVDLLQNNDKKIQKRTKLNGKQISVLQSKDDRNLWENTFTNYIDKLNPDKMIKRFRAQCDQSSDDLQKNSLEALIDGRLNFYSKCAREVYGIKLPLLWQVRQKPRFDLFIASFFSDQNNLKEFPFLGMVLNNNAKLAIFSSFIDLMKWPQFINKNSLNQMSKKQVEEFTIEEWIQSQYCKDQYEARNLAFKFISSWNNLLVHLPINSEGDRYVELCRDFVIIPPLSSDHLNIPLKSSIMFESDNGQLRSLFYYLITQQNIFLEIAVNSDSKSLHLFSRNNSIPMIKFSSINPDLHIIQWEKLEEDSFLIRASCYSPLLGDKPIFDWEKLEKFIAKKLVNQKNIIQIPTPNLNLAQPLFYSFLFDNLNKSREISMIAKICDKPLNISLSDEEQISHHADEAYKLLKNILMILTHEVNTSDQFLSKPIKKYYQECFPNNNETLKEVNRIFSPSNNTPISSFVSLFEFVEDILAQRLIPTLSSAFKVDLNVIQKKELDQVIGRVNIQILMKMIRRYCFRELLTSSTVQTDLQLFHCILAFDWPKNSLKESNDSFELDNYLEKSMSSIFVVHTVKSLEYLQAILNKRKEDEQKQREVIGNVHNPPFRNIVTNPRVIKNPPSGWKDFR